MATTKTPKTKTTRKSIAAETKYASHYDNVAANLAQQRRITLRGGVNEDMAGHLLHSIDYLAGQNKKPIEIALTTHGGSVQDGLAIYDKIQEIRSRGIEVNITVFGYAMSMGVPILQAATNRIAGANSTFLLHEVSYGLQGSHSANKDRIASTERLGKRLNAIILARSTMTEAQLIEQQERRDYIFNADEALAHGLIDRIL